MYNTLFVKVSALVIAQLAGYSFEQHAAAILQLLRCLQKSMQLDFTRLNHSSRGQQLHTSLVRKSGSDHIANSRYLLPSNRYREIVDDFNLGTLTDEGWPNQNQCLVSVPSKPCNGLQTQRTPLGGTKLMSPGEPQPTKIVGNRYVTGMRRRLQSMTFPLLRSQTSSKVQQQASWLWRQVSQLWRDSYSAGDADTW